MSLCIYPHPMWMMQYALSAATWVHCVCVCVCVCVCNSLVLCRHPILLSLQSGFGVPGVWSGDRDGLSQSEMGICQFWVLPNEEGNTWQDWKVSSILCAQLGYDAYVGSSVDYS